MIILVPVTLLSKEMDLIDVIIAKYLILNQKKWKCFVGYFYIVL